MKNKFSVLGMLVIVLALGLVLAGCATDGGDKTYALGDTGPGGGKIFYYSEEGFTMTDNGQVCHYLEAAPNDMATTLAWASAEFVNVGIGGEGDKFGGSSNWGIGKGRRNTAVILATDANAPAALACKNLTAGGKTDWFLPSYSELAQLVFTNRAYVSNITTDWYWSSSQDGADAAHQVSSNGDNDRSKKDTLSVRAIRAF